MDSKEFLDKNPDVKLGEFIEEEIPVKKIQYDPETHTVNTITKMEKQKVMYIDAPKEKYRCKSGQHYFECVDNKRYIFSCTKCSFSRQVYPSTYKFENGQLIHRITGKTV